MLLSPTVSKENMSQVGEYSRIQSEYATYSSSQGIQQAIQETNKSLRPLRAKTSPVEDLERERLAISRELRQDMFLAQLASFLVVLSLLSYIMLPPVWAHGITFLLLSVGIATGFFLRR
jgi:hypothetical protein